jgi:hypothetical protein
MKKKNLLMTAIAIIGLATITSAQVPSYVPTTGLAGYWPFNGNANDESGNGNNGTVNGAALTTDRNGNTNSAYSFDGINDFIIANSNPLYVSDTLTISIWINTNITPPIISNYTIFELGGTGGSDVRWGCIAEPDNAVMAIGRGCGGAGNAPISTSYNGGWSNFIFVVSGLNQSIYYNSNLIGNSTNSQITSLSCSIANLYFGVSQWSSSYYFNGKLDDIGIWNRALSPQEITDLYNGCQLSVNIQPTNQTININNNSQFVVSSTDPSATYQWQTDLGVGFQNLNSVGQYSGTTNDTLTIANTTMSNNNQPFRCIVTLGSCSDTSNVAFLTVNNNVGINETSHDNLFSVFPNPAQSVINVKADSKLIGSIYTIYDNTGKVVLTGNLNSKNKTIELGNLSGGIYLFSVGENMKQTFKVIKE